MKGSFTAKNAASILLCLLVAISRPIDIEGYTMNETCGYIQKGYIGDPTNCQNWGYCSGGYLIGTGSCNPGLLFDSKASMCNYAKDVVCLTSVENACTVATEPGYIGDPNNCNRYCYCANGVAQCLNCPQYQVFDPEQVACVWGKNYQCPANSICRLVANNVFAGDPTICGNYVRCQNGAGVSLPCPNGLLFNPSLNSCDSSYTCNANPGTNTPSNPNVPPTSKTACSPYTGTGTQYMTDGITCYGFYSCSSATAIGIWGSCPFATHFNPANQKCVTPYTYACPYNRCGNLALPFVATKGCAGYSVCTNQVATSTGICADITNGFDYFDEFGGACVATMPQEAICTAQ